MINFLTIIFVATYFQPFDGSPFQNLHLQNVNLEFQQTCGLQRKLC